MKLRPGDTLNVYEKLSAPGITITIRREVGGGVFAVNWMSRQEAARERRAKRYWYDPKKPDDLKPVYAVVFKCCKTLH